MPRHEKPQILIDYEAKIFPEICHTCEAYSNEGICMKHNQEPPEDFAATHKACPDYYMEVPF